MTAQSDVVIIGAGIIGLASGYQILKQNPRLRVKILEKELIQAKHQTGNNSGVIHSGVYYKPGSLKAKNCTDGKNELLEFCMQFGIETQKLGKVIIATEMNQIPSLDVIESRGRSNGVLLERVGSSRLKEIEPHVVAIDGIWVPECSIISYREVAKNLTSEFQKLGGSILFNESVHSIITKEQKIYINTLHNEHCARCLVNCAGLFSDRIARKIMGKEKVQQRIIPFRGEYYQLSHEASKLVNGLIYPVPDPRFPFLGVHLTRMINGKVEAGPNAILALAREGYRKRDVNIRDCLDVLSYPGFWRMATKYWKAGFYEIARSLSKRMFLRDLQKLVPAIQEKDLSIGGVGIRAQVVARDGNLVDDFSIIEEKNMIHVLNAPSPAATASFAIGRQIADRTSAHLKALALKG